jgi:O-antigen/teichoic acid export membrane protein
VAIYGIGEIGARAVGLLTIPAFAAALSRPDFGAYTVILATAGLLNVILVFGGDSALIRLFFEAQSDQERRVVTTTSLVVVAAGSLLSVLILLPLSGATASLLLEGGSHAALVMLMLVTVPIALVNNICGVALRNVFRPATFAALNSATIVLTAALGLVAVYPLHLGVAGLVGSVLAAELAVLPVWLWAIRSQLTRAVSWRVALDLGRYGLPLLPSVIAYWLFLTVDRLLLSSLGSLTDVGVYGIANYAVAILALSSAALSQAWGPHALAAYERNADEARALFGRMLVALTLGAGWMCLAVTLFRSEIVRFLGEGRYAGAAAAVGPLALANFALATTAVTSLGLTVSKRPGTISKQAVKAAIVNVTLCFALIPSFGVRGAAWATTAAYVVLTVEYLRASQRVYPISLPGQKLVAATAITFGTTLIAMLMNASSTTAASVTSRGAIAFVGFPALVVLCRVVSHDDLHRLSQAFLGAVRSLADRRTSATVP